MSRARATLSVAALAALLIVPAAGQQSQTDRESPAGGRGSLAAPSLLFRETWRLEGRPHAIEVGANVLTNPNLELKLYGPCATAQNPDQRIWISGPPANLWTGMCTVPFAAALRHKQRYVDLSGLAKMRWVTRASGFHAVRPIVKLADGTALVGDYADSSTTVFAEREFAFAGMRWMKLDLERIVTTGTYGPLGEASNWLPQPDLRKVDEVGFTDLMRGSGGGPGGGSRVDWIEVYGNRIPR